MSAGPTFHVTEDPPYGVVLRCTDAELADQFEDFLSEKNFVLFNTKFQEADVLFYFGQASSLDAVRRLVERFEAELRSGE
ncbi:MAG: hypothetical protein MUF80_00765 [Burkholderiales bacterium]|nr:hypothetical protein [Burkholderiales bacterium]